MWKNSETEPVWGARFVALPIFCEEIHPAEQSVAANHPVNRSVNLRFQSGASHGCEHYQRRDCDHLDRFPNRCLKFNSD